MYISPSASVPKEVRPFRGPRAGRQVLLLHRPSVLQPERAHEAAAVVAVEVGPRVSRHAAAAVDDPSRHRASFAVPVLDDGQGVGARRTGGVGGEARGSLGDRPPVVLSAPARRQAHVDLLVASLAHVADVEIAGHGIEGEAPGVAQAQGPDLPTGPGVLHEGVGGRDDVGGAVRVDAQDLAQEGGQGTARCPRDRPPSPRRRGRCTGVRRGRTATGPRGGCRRAGPPG